MANPPKQKGTGGEREVLTRLLDAGLRAQRTPPAAAHDITVFGSTGRTLNALATRPDRGTWLVSIPLADFVHLLMEHGDNANIEVKRYRRFAHHTIFTDTFGA